MQSMLLSTSSTASAIMPISRKGLGRSVRPVVVVRAEKKAVSRAAEKQPAGIYYNAAFLAALASMSAAAPAIAEEGLGGVTVSNAVSKVESLAASIPPATSLVDDAVNNLISGVKTAGGVAKAGVDAAGYAYRIAADAYTKVSPTLKQGADVAAPYVKSALKTANDVAAPLIRAAKPTVQSGLTEADKFLSAQGLNSKALLDGAKTASEKAAPAVDSAKPVVENAVGQLNQNLATSSPAMLAQEALGLVAIYFLGPPILKTLFNSFRGYTADLTPAAVLDSVVNNGGSYLVDVRTQREKESAGVPDLPSSGKLIEIEYAQIEDRKLRGLLKNVSAIECEVTVLQIAALKKLGKGSDIILMDKNGGTAKTLARELRKKGFRKVYVVSGGYSNWTNSKLPVKLTSSVSNVEVLGPLSRLPGTIRTMKSPGSAKLAPQRSGARALPSGR